MCLALEGCKEGGVVQINSGGEVPQISSWIHSLDTKFKHTAVSSGLELCSSNRLGWYAAAEPSACLS